MERYKGSILNRAMICRGDIYCVYRVYRDYAYRDMLI